MYCFVCCVSGSLLRLPVRPPAPSVLLENRFLEDEKRKVECCFCGEVGDFCVHLPPHLKDYFQFCECLFSSGCLFSEFWGGSKVKGNATYGAVASS